MQQHSLIPRSGGFTLIEILIGTAILGIMMLILTGSLRIGAQSWEAGETRIERANRQFVIQNFLKLDSFYLLSDSCYS